MCYLYYQRKHKPYTNIDLVGLWWDDRRGKVRELRATRPEFIPNQQPGVLARLLSRSLHVLMRATGTRLIPGLAGGLNGITYLTVSQEAGTQ